MMRLSGKSAQMGGGKELCCYDGFASAFLPSEQPSADILILISHDCDIVCRDFEREPTVEVIAATRVDRSDAALANGKNPRVLELPISTSSEEVPFHIAKRVMAWLLTMRFFNNHREAV